MRRKRLMVVRRPGPFVLFIYDKYLEVHPVIHGDFMHAMK